MGAGREGESCLIGGSRGRAGIPNPSPITSWMELKLYHTHAIRGGFYCLPRNDLFFKWGGTEEYILNEGGAAVQVRVPDANNALTRYMTIPWPKGWRGYVSDPVAERRFPNLGRGAPAMQIGLDNARPGDVLVFDEDVVMRGGPRGEGVTNNYDVWRQPYVAFVTEVDNERQRAGGATNVSLDPNLAFVSAIARNHGKFPDACGNTTDFLMGSEYRMYKGALPSEITARLNAIGQHTDRCVDPSLTNCIEPRWNEVKRFVIHEGN